MLNIDEEKIIDFLLENSKKPLKIKELSQKLGLKASDRSKLRRIMKNLTKRGDIVQLKGRKYTHPKNSKLFTGRIKRHPDGYGFVIPESKGDKDLFLTSSNFRHAMHGDKVLVRIDKKKHNGRIEGSVVKIIEREKKILVGKFECFNGSYVIKPEDPRFPDEIIIPKGEINGAENGQVVVAEITHYPDFKNNFFYGKITRILGFPGDPGVEFLIIVHNFDLPFEFSPDTKKDVLRINTELCENDFKCRVDLRDRLIITIDGDDARDFDDAVSLDLVDDGYLLGVHIADVSHYVQMGSAIDKDAFERGTSVYFPDSVIPMLPFELSNNTCSLIPGEDRLTVSVEMKFDNEGNLTSHNIFESVINSKYRLTYNKVHQIITNQNSEIVNEYREVTPLLKKMNELASSLKKKRRERMSLDFDLPEPEILFNKDGELIGIFKSIHNEAHSLIEEFMLQANETVATHLTEKGIEMLYRIHEEPDPESIKELSQFLKGLGIQSKKTTPLSWFTEIIKKTENHPLKHVITQLTLRSLKKAVYSERNMGHFGLALDIYTHFTSPIRRYPDLVVHRILKKVLSNENENYKYSSEKLHMVAEQTSFCEVRADEAQRDIIALKRVQFMQDKVGNDYDGIIISVLPFGFFVELVDFFVEGLVHVNSLEDDYYIYNESEKSLIGKKTSRKFELGNSVKVRISNTDIQRRTITFILPELILRGKSEKKNKGKFYKRKKKRLKRK